MPFYVPNDIEKEALLVQHVPHRICAALPWLRMPEKWIVARPKLPNMDFGVWCVDRSIDEGRKAAMRWLIEFIGIRLDKNGNVAPTVAYPNGKSVTIAQVGGSMFDTKSADAKTLADIWQACTQASLHPTMDTKHGPERPDDLARALQIVIAHLENTLYTPLGRDLCKIVLDQEELTIARERSIQESSPNQSLQPTAGRSDD